MSITISNGGIFINGNNDFLNEEFFIIDCDNVNSIETAFYGYTIQNNTIIDKSTFDINGELNGTGAYVLIKAENEGITIHQDNMGCYGIYEYRNGDYFAVSNSFLKLVEFLYNTSNPITFNEDFANHYLSTGITPMIPDETLVNEIRILPRNYIVHINKSDNAPSYEELDFKENTIPIDSAEGIEILDRWYNRWSELIRDLRAKTNFLTMDLSGGFDSRVVSALWLSSNINLDNILIHSTEVDTERFNEDLEIASEIASHFGFRLNQERNINIIPIEMEETLNRPSYVELGFHKHRVHPTMIYQYPLYRFSGHCGGLVRNYPNKTLEEYIEDIVRRSKRFDNTTRESTRKLLDSKIDDFSAKYGLDKNSKRLASLLYRETRNRHHFGKEWIDSYLYNKITLAPLSDPDLSKLKVSTEEHNNDLLLFSLIFLRYCPDLIDFKIEGGREIGKDTIELASKINEKYPFYKREVEYIAGPEIDLNIENKPKINTAEDVKKIFKDIFFSQNFMKEFEKYYSPQIYDKIRYRCKNRKSSPFEDVYASIDILKIRDYVKVNHTLNTGSYGDWLNSYDIIEQERNELKIEGNNKVNEKLVEKYRTLRVDMKNIGLDTNNLEIIEKSSKYSMDTTPEWFGKSKGIGHVIYTKQSCFDLKLKMVNDGLFHLRLRGMDVRDINDKKFPVYIDCKKLEINGKDVLDENVLVCHQDPYSFKKEVLDGETLSIHIEWLPFNDESIYRTEELDMLRHTVDTEIFNFDNFVKRSKEIIRNEKNINEN